MVIIASMIGVKGLGLEVLRSISNQYLAIGLLNGIAIVATPFKSGSQHYQSADCSHLSGANYPLERCGWPQCADSGYPA